MKKSILGLLIIFLSNVGYGQVEDTDLNQLKLTFSTGLSKIVIKDKVISSQKYTGDLTPYYFSWEKVRPGYTWNLIFQYETGTIRNNNVTSNMDDLSLGWNYSYQIKRFNIFHRSATIFGGFSPNLWIYNRKQNLAEPEQYLYSFKALINMGINANLKGSFSSKMEYRLSTNLNLLSYGISSEVIGGNVGAVSKFSTPFSTPLWSWRATIDYSIMKWLSLGVTYRFKYYHHELVNLGSDSFQVLLTTKF